MSEKLISSWGTAPAAQERDEERPHRCGKCANPYTYGNPACVNAPRPS